MKSHPGGVSYTENMIDYGPGHISVLVFKKIKISCFNNTVVISIDYAYRHTVINYLCFDSPKRS